MGLDTQTAANPKLRCLWLKDGKEFRPGALLRV